MFSFVVRQRFFLSDTDWCWKKKEETSAYKCMILLSCCLGTNKLEIQCTRFWQDFTILKTYMTDISIQNAAQFLDNGCFWTWTEHGVTIVWHWCIMLRFMCVLWNIKQLHADTRFLSFATRTLLIVNWISH